MNRDSPHDRGPTHPDERWEFQIDPETGRGGWHQREESLVTTIALAPFRGLAEIVSGIRHGTLTTADWIFLIVVVTIVLRA